MGGRCAVTANTLPALSALAVAVLSVVAWNHHRDIHLQID